MYTHESINALREIRIELLHYWQTETNEDRKNSLSEKLNALDKVIIDARKALDSRLKLLDK